MSDNTRIDENAKQQSLDPEREQANGQYLTTNQGVPIHHTDDALKARERGPTLMEDFHFRQK